MDTTAIRADAILQNIAHQRTQAMDALAMTQGDLAAANARIQQLEAVVKSFEAADEKRAAKRRPKPAPEAAPPTE